MLLSELRLHFYFFHPIFMDTGSTTDPAADPSTDTDSNMSTGVIKKLLNGFGFISREGSDDLFFHSADLVDVAFDDLREGDNVQFEVGSGTKGPKADKVSKV